MNERSWRAVPLLLLSASCVMPGKQAPRPAAAASTVAPRPTPSTPIVERREVASISAALPVPPVPAAEAAVKPVVTPTAPAPRLPTARQAAFSLASTSDDDRARSLECLTEAVYYEARSEPLQGQRAVAQVVLNRVRHPAFPNSVCGVVFQGAERRTGCQFSFTCDGSRYRPREAAAWRRARDVAEAALAGESDPRIGYSTHFHTNAVSPWWKRSLRLVASVGSHIFYGWKGQQGASARFDQQYAGKEPGTRARPAAVAVPAPTPRMREVLAFEEDAVTVHRGPAAVAVETPPVAQASAVRVHHGSEPALPRLAIEPEAFGVRVHRSAT